nr:MAG TPA: Protein of unknown function (DUF2897) [Bacteriophage sp.]
MVYVWILIGVLIGSVVSNIIFYCRSSSGVFRIDHSDPEKDVYRFEIDDLDKLDKKSRLILKIDHNANLSQK